MATVRKAQVASGAVRVDAPALVREPPLRPPTEPPAMLRIPTEARPEPRSEADRWALRTKLRDPRWRGAVPVVLIAAVGPLVGWLLTGTVGPQHVIIAV